MLPHTSLAGHGPAGSQTPLSGDDITDITEHVNSGHVPELLHCVRAFTDLPAANHAQVTAIYAGGVDLEVHTASGLAQRFVPFTTQAPPHEALRATVAAALARLGIKPESRVAHWTVAEARLFTAHMRRLTLKLPEDEAREWAPGYACRFDVPGQQHGRPYTLRRLKGNMAEVDVYCHSGTLGSRWAQGLVAGDSVTVRGGRRESFPGFGVGPALLLGDETALPTIAALLDTWPHETPVRAILEVGSPDEQAYLRDVCLPRAAHVSWVPKAKGSADGVRLLLDSLEMTPAAIWGALEVSAVRALRRDLTELYPGAEVHLSGYWRYGENG